MRLYPWWAWFIVCTVNMRILHKGKKGKLCKMGKHTHVEECVWSSHDRNTVQETIPYRVHWMRKHLKDAIEVEMFVKQEEEIASVSGEITNNTMCIRLTSDWECNRCATKQVSTPVLHKWHLAWWRLSAHDSQHNIGHEVISKNYIFYLSKHHSRVKLIRVVFSLVCLLIFKYSCHLQ